MTERMQVDGACHCGSVTYKAMVDPDQVSICHCTDCQVLTGTAFRVSVPAALDEVQLTGNSPTIYTKVGESGGRRDQAFCGECGSPVYVTGDIDDPTAWLRWGGIQQRGKLIPTSAIWCSSAVPWLAKVTTIPGSEKE